MTDWRAGHAAVAVLSFDVDAESAILAEGRRYAEQAMVMTHQAFGPRTGVPRLLALLAEYGLRATFFIPGLTADRYPETVQQVLAAGHEVGHHSYSHRSPVPISPPTRSGRTSSVPSPRCTPPAPSPSGIGPRCGRRVGARQSSWPSTACATTRP
jgi:hypothetical protein